MEKNFKLFEKLILELKNNYVVVEGKKDKDALKNIGCRNIIPIQGKKFEQIENLFKKIDSEKIIILTDMDKEGERLAKELENICRSTSKYCNTQIRKQLSGLLKLQYWETIDKKIERFIEENED
ncbi:toprim domain-containing protein [Candidatus Micrarchaeota archaeon]|nr:toprim domain-containing protein [Candidatus Micrarchaeota archaeon]